MNNQDLLNAISTLIAAIDPLTRAGKKEEVTVISDKIVELIKKLN